MATIKIDKYQPAVCQPLPSEQAYSNVLPTWTAVSYLEITSKRSYSPNSNSSNNSNMDYKNTKSQGPNKKSKISKQPTSTDKLRVLPSIECNNRHLTSSTPYRSLNFQPPNESNIISGPLSESSTDTSRHSAQNGLTSRIFPREIEHSDQVRPTTGDNITEGDHLHVATPDYLCPAKRRLGNQTSSRTLAASISTGASVATSAPTSSSSQSSGQRTHTRYREGNHKDAQRQWEPPKEARRRVTAAREVDAEELEILTNADVAPVVRMRKYASTVPSEKREAALRWNLRWVRGMVDRVGADADDSMNGQIEESQLARGGSSSYATIQPELTREQRCDLILTDIYGDEEVDITPSEQ